MIENRSKKQFNRKVIKTAVALAGIIIVVFTFALDSLGFGSQGSFGIGQFLLLIVGIFILLSGLIGRKVFAIYRGIAIILLNTLFVLMFIELAAIVFARSGQNYDTETYSLPYYANQEWTEQYFDEAFAAEVFHYEPYVIWKHMPFDGKLMKLDQDGFRKTPGANCTDEAYTIFAFGGSTMLGWGSPDWGTIPAYLQVKLNERLPQDVCVINFGQSGYVSTQSLVALMLELQDNNVPDLVIFYDGVNEVQAAYESGQAGKPVNFEQITNRFEQREHPLLSFLKKTRSYALAENWVISQAQKQAEEGSLVTDAQLKTGQIENISENVATIYLENYELVGTLSSEYNFDYIFLLQPHLAVGQKELTPEEMAIFSKMNPLLISLAPKIYQYISDKNIDSVNFANLQDVFADTSQQIWIDAGGHITPEGNLLIAEEINKLLIERK